jgi:thiamine pyrophosphate-dependent acetolactate synthase large subunit-like protein
MRPGGPQRVVGTDLSDADYHLVMAAFGGQGARGPTIEDLRLALTKAVESGIPTCINVSTNSGGLAPEIPLLNS